MLNFQGFYTEELEHLENLERYKLLRHLLHVLRFYYRLDIIATTHWLSHKLANNSQFLTKSNFSDTLSKSFKIFSLIK